MHRGRFKTDLVNHQCCLTPALCISKCAAKSTKIIIQVTSCRIHRVSILPSGTFCTIVHNAKMTNPLKSLVPAEGFEPPTY